MNVVWFLVHSTMQTWWTRRKAWNETEWWMGEADICRLLFSYRAMVVSAFSILGHSSDCSLVQVLMKNGLKDTVFNTMQLHPSVHHTNTIPLVWYPSRSSQTLHCALQPKADHAVFHNDGELPASCGPDPEWGPDRTGHMQACCLSLVGQRDSLADSLGGNPSKISIGREEAFITWWIKHVWMSFPAKKNPPWVFFWEKSVTSSPMQRFLCPVRDRKQGL